MNDTSLSLLNRLQESSESETWDRLVELYTPLLRSWLRRYSVQPTDADDLIQEVLLAVSRDLPEFDHSGRSGAFRGWLRSILVNRLRTFWRNRNRHGNSPNDSEIDNRLAQLGDPSSELSQIWNREHDQYVLRQLMALTEPHFSETTWAAFRRVALEGAKANVVAKELNISLNAVFVAKSRVLNRLRQESEGIIESSSNFSLGN